MFALQALQLKNTNDASNEKRAPVLLLQPVFQQKLPLCEYDIASLQDVQSTVAESGMQRVYLWISVICQRVVAMWAMLGYPLPLLSEFLSLSHLSPKIFCNIAVQVCKVV